MKWSYDSKGKTQYIAVTWNLMVIDIHDFLMPWLISIIICRHIAFVNPFLTYISARFSDVHCCISLDFILGNKI